MAEPIDIKEFKVYEPHMQQVYWNVLMMAADDVGNDLRNTLPQAIKMFGLVEAYRIAVTSYDQRFAEENNPEERFFFMERVYNAMLYCQRQISIG